jgi:hypothetical protein
MHGSTEWALTILVFLGVFGLVVGLYSRAILNHRRPDDVTATGRRRVSRQLGLVLGAIAGLAAALLFHAMIFSVNVPN